MLYKYCVIYYNDGHGPKRTCDITARSNGFPHEYDKRYMYPKLMHLLIIKFDGTSQIIMNVNTLILKDIFNFVQ
jgi:hypothetical protein